MLSSLKRNDEQQQYKNQDDDDSQADWKPYHHENRGTTYPETPHGKRKTKARNP
jgi:hypothetical protein